jgi:hypothetical protein
MSWVARNGAYVSSDRVSSHYAGYDRIWELNNALAGQTGHPMTLLLSGCSKYGKFIYKDDGFVYTARRKAPIGRYLRLQRVGHFELALKRGRFEDVARLEEMRWRTLSRIKKSLVPELGRRCRELKKHTKRTFRGYYNGVLYSITTRDEIHGISFHAVDLVSEQKNLGELDKLAHQHTDPEDDEAAAHFISMSDRVARAHRSVHFFEAVMLAAINEKIHDKCGLNPKHDAGALVDVRINGRVYQTWVGRGSTLFSNDQTKITEFWPHPGRKVFDLSSGPAVRARYV